MLLRWWPLPLLLPLPLPCCLKSGRGADPVVRRRVCCADASSSLVVAVAVAVVVDFGEDDDGGGGGGGDGDADCGFWICVCETNKLDCDLCVLQNELGCAWITVVALM